MDQGITWSRRQAKVSSHEKRLLALGLTFLAIVSPLYVDRMSQPDQDSEDEEPINLSSYLPLFLLVLIAAIAVSSCWEHGFARFDPYWIHRAGGSSAGIVVILVFLGLVLKFKASCSE